VFAGGGQDEANRQLRFQHADRKGQSAEVGNISESWITAEPFSGWEFPQIAHKKQKDRIPAGPQFSSFSLQSYSSIAAIALPSSTDSRAIGVVWASGVTMALCRKWLVLQGVVNSCAITIVARRAGIQSAM